MGGGGMTYVVQFVSRRVVCARMENTKWVNNEAHSLFGNIIPATNRLKSRGCF